MTEEQFLDIWYKERPSVEAWGRFVSQKLVQEISPRVAPLSADIFVKLPVIPRLKGDGSLLTKAFYRNKPYTDPLNEITDKVGIRFVVLLASQIPVVGEAIEQCIEWVASKDRDYEGERENKPYEFGYQSVHYVVRNTADRVVGEVEIPAGVPCEIQVRTLMQHAHSELTHDTIYKPSVAETPEMHRAAAKSMALIEATNDYFEKLMELIAHGVAPNKELAEQMGDIYQKFVGTAPDPTRAEAALAEAYIDAFDDPISAIRALCDKKNFVSKRIESRAPTKLLFRQPGILLAYAAVDAKPEEAKERWPFTELELKAIFSDLGKAFPQS